MPNFEFTSPEGKKYTIEGPEGATKEQAFQMLQTHLSGSKAAPASAPAPAASVAPKKELSFGEAAAEYGKSTLRNARDVGAGAIRGAGSIGSTLLAGGEAIESLKQFKMPTLDRDRERRASMDAALGDMGADTESAAFGVGKVGAEIAGTLGTGGLIANGARGALATSIATGGMRAGAVPGVANMATRVAGGAINGAASAGLVNPEYAGTGAIIGGALPPVLATVGKVGRAVGNSLAGPVVAPELKEAFKVARAEGYVAPPTQVNPTLINRGLEGFAGKLTTAQNASASNVPITNKLAKRAIGAADLSEAGIAQVRAKANQAYDALAQAGKFQADAGFAQALDQAGATTAAMRQNFPELANSRVDDLITGLKSRPEFEAQSTIEAIKQFRADASVNKIALDPAQKALGRAQAKIAGALEDLIERNLQASGNQQLLAGYREARQTLAKTYQVEKALNKTTGNVDANKLAQMMQKGKPMTGDLKTIADFAARFPKANQTVERMGSLPGISPLDFGALGTMSAATSNPALMAGILARPAARSLTLSAPVQNRLAAQPGQNRLLEMIASPKAEQLLYRAAPTTSAR